MHTAKFPTFSLNDLYYGEKYLPEEDKGIPVPNEVLHWIECLSSTSNESEIGVKLFFATLAYRNIQKYLDSWLTIDNLCFFCNGYSSKSIRKGAEWLVRKGLFIKRNVAHNKAEFQINYIKASFQEISSNIKMQIKNGVRKEEVVFKGIRYLTATCFKKDWDSKATGYFTHIPFFLPSANACVEEKSVSYIYKKNSIFNLLDGNTLKVILKLSYFMNFNMSKSNSPETETKTENLMKKCGLSKNKVEKAMKYLIKGKFLRSYKIKRNSRKYIFNFRSHREARVNKLLLIRKSKNREKNIKLSYSVAVPGQLNDFSLLLSRLKRRSVLPSQVIYNKDSLKNMQVGDNQYRKEEKRIFHNQEKEKYNIYDKIKTELLLKLRTSNIPLELFMDLTNLLEKMKDQDEEISSWDSFIESYNKSQTDESKKIEREMELEATY